jgi:hypothetical protein
MTLTSEPREYAEIGYDKIYKKLLTDSMAI